MHICQTVTRGRRLQDRSWGNGGIGQKICLDGFYGLGGEYYASMLPHSVCEVRIGLWVCAGFLKKHVKQDQLCALFLKSLKQAGVESSIQGLIHRLLQTPLYPGVEVNHHQFLRSILWGHP